MLVSCVSKGVTSCLFVCLECVHYLVDYSIFSGYAKTFYVWVHASG